MGRPVISNIRPPDGPVWDLNELEHDAFFALSGTGEFDALIARLHLDGTELTADGLGEYDYAFFGTNGSDTITGVTEGEGDNSGVIASGNGSDHVTAGSGDHVVFAGNGKDTVRGGGGDDIIFGENGKDELAGNAGDDEVLGGKGKDTLTGGIGDDELTGGKGGDEFHWNQTADFGDTVTDFTAGSDKLVFDVGDEDPQISVGNDDTLVDGYVEGTTAEINVAGTEIGVKIDDALLTTEIQGEINTYDAITGGALFAFFDETEGHAVLYYDADRLTDDDATLVAEFTNITSLEQLATLSATDFMFA
jgi:Ca2+-binding RTX toxin-like protein